MLNRTNRTLSANLNRLNLGTRSLVASANEFNGMVTLRADQTHGGTPRGGMDPTDHDFAMDHPSPVIPGSIPSSSPVDQWSIVGPVVVSAVSERSASRRQVHVGTLKQGIQARAGAIQAQFPYRARAAYAAPSPETKRGEPGRDARALRGGEHAPGRDQACSTRSSHAAAIVAAVGG